MTEKYDVKRKQAKALEDFENLIGKSIPIVEEIENVQINPGILEAKIEGTFGVKIEGNNVTGLGLYEQGLTTLPVSIGNLKSLQILNLRSNKLTTLPESIGNLSSLKKLWIQENNLITLPESIGNLSSLQAIDLMDNQLSTLPESIGNLSSLQDLSLRSYENNKNNLTTLPDSITKLTSLERLVLTGNQLTTLPKSIGNLRSLQKLYLSSNKIAGLPKSIGNLKSLQTLISNGNEIETLPESIGNLSSLQTLDLKDNQLSTLPDSFWRLKNLKSLSLSENPWEDAWKGINKYTIQTVLERSRQRAPIIVFISHSKGDKQQYCVSNLKKELKEQNEICEVHGSGENDISESQLVLFIATKNSMSDEQCRHELELALTSDIGIIPIKGTDITFEDLSQIDLGEDFNLKDKLGLEFDSENFKKFSDELYEHIKKYKREFNVFELNEKKFDELWVKIKIISENFIESDEFRDKFAESNELFKKLDDELRTQQISLVEYISRTGQIFKPKSK